MTPQSQGDNEEEEEEETDGGGANHLMLMPDGPPNWTQCQRQSHKYEQVEILDDSSPEEYPSLQFPHKSTSARSVGNLHMTWDESDVRYKCIHIHIHIYMHVYTFNIHACVHVYTIIIHTCLYMLFACMQNVYSHVYIHVCRGT